MDRQGPPIRPRYQLTSGLNMFRERKRYHALYDVTLSRQEGSTRRHLANAHSVTGPAGMIYRTSFSGIWRDRSCRPVKQLSIGGHTWSVSSTHFLSRQYLKMALWIKFKFGIYV